MHTVRTENDTELDIEPRRAFPPQLPDPQRRNKRLRLALGLLLLALVAVIFKSWDFWFPAPPEPSAATSRPKAAKTSPDNSASEQPGTAAKVVDRRPLKSPAQPVTTLAASTERAALPDLQVEVVAGNQRKTLPAHSNAINLDVAGPGSSNTTQVTPQQMVANSASVQMSAQTSQNVSRTVAPAYPLLARQMKVQGAVILQALISRDGSIQELQIVNGPGILAAAAREAVKQWHFKPYYQDGQPVETQARITVNFTISTN